MTLTASYVVWRRATMFATGDLSLGEISGMWSEKPLAFMAGVERAMAAAAAGRSPPATMRIALAPAARKARANARRLSR